jgi:sarcosine oxidase / L-pipecolate oxidase
LKHKQDMLDHCWQLTGPLTNFRGYFNRLEGYAHSADALRGIATKLAGSGVKFVLGPEKGHVVELLYTNSGPSSSRRCSGVRTRNNVTHTFSTVICALGAYGASLVPQLGAFNVARCWSVAHIQLTPQECDVLRGIPIVNVLDLGFFFEPDPATRLLKLTPLGGGYSNFDGTKTGRRMSLPPGHDGQPVAGQLHDYVPLADEVRMRKLLRETLPWLADRPFVDRKMCWFSDTVDSEYCIDFAPDTDSSLIVLSGDSGHGFKMMPIFGQWVCELLDRGVQQRQGWRWRTVDAGEGGADWGSDVSWRFGESAEVGDVARERERMVKARL